MKGATSLLLTLLGLAARTTADPTWPADIDELEEIMYQTTGVRSRKFADSVNPCKREVSGAGRKNAAEWLRTAFHDMAPANVYRGTGGMDASLQYELGSSDNTGPGFGTTMTFMAPYLTRKSSMSDLIALGVYTSVLSCKGPSVAIRAGRIDATGPNDSGAVPTPGDSTPVFLNRFVRMGFSTADMIQMTACGHTIGGVHSADHPDIVPAGQFTNEVATFDTTDAAFDPKVITEYLAGTTQNPLVNVPGTQKGKNSDFRVFNADNNATAKAMTDATIFNNVCKAIFERMVNVVPSGVTLSDPIQPYQVKPVQMQLTLADVSTLSLTGVIRVRTTNFPLSNIASLTINYKNRNGGTVCGSGACAFTITVSGASTNLEESFAWFTIMQNQQNGVRIPVSSGISSFTVTINMNDGSTKFFDNNGNGYPMQDGIFLQTDQSCLTQSNGNATFVAAVRNDRISQPVSVNVWYKTKRTTSVVPLLSNMTLAMTQGACQGGYTFFTVTTTIPGGVSVESTMDLISGDMVDSFKKANTVGGTCQQWSGGSSCSSITVSSVVPTSTATAPSHRATMGGYKFVSCWTEATNGRALKGAAFAYDGMTLSSCMANCTGFDYWGTEYGRECYCGNSLDSTSTSALLVDCNMPCSEDSTQYCGAGNRIELYSTTATRTSSSAASATATLAHISAVGQYSLVGCQTEATNGRALQETSTAADDMTLEKCATFCSGYTYFGTEYGRECYCGNSLQDTSKPAPITDCSMKCAGKQYQYCGDGNRLELYKLGTSSSSSHSSIASATTTASSSSSRISSSFSSSITPSSTFSALGASGSSSSSSSAPSTGSSTFSTVVSSTSSAASSTRISSSSASTLSAEAVSSPVSSSSATSSTSSSSTSKPVSTSAALSSTSSLVSPTTMSSATSTLPTLAHKATVAAYNLTGCWTEGNGVRALSQNSYASHDNMTLENCAAFCSGYKYFGTEYGGECYCGNFLASSSSSAPLSDCSMTCTGNQYAYCGAGNRLTLYTNNNDKVTDPSQPATAGVYSFLGCRTEPAQGGRALSAKATASDKMTNEVCASFCDGFAYFGTEYSGECYCGYALPDTSLVAPWQSIPRFPEEDAKLRATSLRVRRGGNCPNTIEVLQQLLRNPPRGGEESSPQEEALQMHLVSPLPERQSQATANIIASLTPTSPSSGREPSPSSSAVNFDHSLFRVGYQVPASCYILRSEATGSRTIVNHNDLPEMTAAEFLVVAEAFRGRGEKTWWHFEGRIPETTLECVRSLRRVLGASATVSVEVEKPGRPGLRELAAEADVVFYSKSWAEHCGYTSAEACLRGESQSRASLAMITWGAEGASCLSLQDQRYVERPVEHAVQHVADSVGAGDTFVAGMLYGLICRERWELGEKLGFAVDLATLKVQREGFSGLGDDMQSRASGGSSVSDQARQ
ncbi:wsc domain containing protein [Colletotrichum asianum]